MSVYGDEWEDADVSPNSLLEELVSVSRQIGTNPRLVLFGGGNSSIKLDGSDFKGDPARVLWIKSSGSDLGSVTADDFVGVVMDDLQRLIEREAMDDDEIVNFITHVMVNPNGPLPSIETLLHAFLPFGSVLHSHADAILTLSNVTDSHQVIQEALGDDVVVVPYIRPGFQLAKTAALALRLRTSDIRGMVLLHHGLLTWGDTPKEAYALHEELIAQAEQYISNLPAPVIVRSPFLPNDRRKELVQRIAPLLRKYLSADRRVLLSFSDNEELLSYSLRKDLGTVIERGVVTPDHLLFIKNTPMVLPVSFDLSNSDLLGLIESKVESYRQRYTNYFLRHSDRSLDMRSPDPVITVVPGVGVWAAGQDASSSRIALEMYAHTCSIYEMTERLGSYSSLSEDEVFDAEYWPMELRKLTLRPVSGEIQGQVAVVTGAAGGIGAAIARRLARAGAAVVLMDRDQKQLESTAHLLGKEVGDSNVLSVVADVSNETDVIEAFEAAVRTYGGVDILVSNAGSAVTGKLTDLSMEAWTASMQVNITGHFLVTREALRVMTRQGLGGSIVFIVSKNAFVPGKEFGAYSIAKAAELQLGRIAAIEHGSDGIRVNMINPDAIWTNLWDERIRADRAKAYQIDESELEDFYRRRSLLQRVVTVDDVAEMVLFLVSERSSKTTGAVIPVDAGIREGFPR